MIQDLRSFWDRGTCLLRDHKDSHALSHQHRIGESLCVAVDVNNSFDVVDILTLLGR